jgi:hypothetical protein
LQREGLGEFKISPQAEKIVVLYILIFTFLDGRREEKSFQTK